MASFIFYNADSENITKTINDLLDKTNKSLIDDIFICNTDNTIRDPNGSILGSSDKSNRANLWNAAADLASGSELVFIGRPTKFSKDWVKPLLAEVKSENRVSSPRIHTLDLNLWSSENNHWSRFGWRWDLDLHSRLKTQTKESPAISSYCMAISKGWFNDIGQFDSGMQDGYGEDIELSLRSWLFGGSCTVCDDSSIASAIRPDHGSRTIQNLTRIIQAWMPNHSTDFKLARNIGDIDCGRIDNLLQLQKYQKKSVDWFLKSLQPDLLGVYRLRNSAYGKSVAIISPGVSIDMINPSLINRHDIIIGVDYMGMLYDCDYIMTSTAHVIIELRKKYDDEKFVLPLTINNRASGRYDSASAIAPNSIQFELAHRDDEISKVGPPFCDYENMTLTATHFALCLNPNDITIYGCDNKIIQGKSHSSRIEYYNNGEMFSDSDSTKRRFIAYETGLSILGKLASEVGVKLFRYNHV